MPAADLRSDETKARDDECHRSVARAVASERERCAKIVLDYSCSDINPIKSLICSNIAALIRNS